MTGKKAASKAADKAAPEAESGKHPGGRPSDYDKVNLRQLRILCRRGFTDQELAEYFDVSRSTISLWKTEHPEFSDTMRLGKDEADDRVERALYDNCVGYEAIDTHFTVVDGKVIQTRYVREYRPEPRSQEFWLRNRRPGRWKQVIDIQDDRLTELVRHMNRSKEAPHGKESRQPRKP